MRRVTKNLSLALAVVLLAIFTGCNSDSEVESKGKAKVMVTDAAVDAEAVTGVYLSVKEVQAQSNGKLRTVARFDNAQEFDVMAYQNGSTYALGEGDIEVGSYEELRLITDGNSYVSFEDGSTKPLDIPSGTSSGYKIKGAFDIAAESATEIVADIDLRKALVVTGNGDYKLRPTARLVTASTTGTIKGNVSGSADKLVVFAYAKGSYAASEASEPAEGSTRFEGSVNSAVVSNGSFTLAFMEEGEYELVVAEYDKDESTGEYTFKSTTEAELLLNGSLINLVKVEANAQVNVLLNLNL